MIDNFPQINARHQTTDPGSSENTKQEFFLKLHKNIIFKLHTIKNNEKILKKVRGKKSYLSYL